ncbi:MAG: tRNA lysidine(34) synthetase TilS [Eubacterium sp.]|nr:tRNA lysidine(34) synthetase TilS [Eubacterium sp.]
MKENVKAFIEKEKLIRPGEKVLAAVSGGADSVCLMLLLAQLQEELDFFLEVIHVEHGIRGEESLKDAQFVRMLSKEKGIPFHIVTVDAPAFAAQKRLGLEEAARILRHQALKETARNCGADKIAVAHHAGDQAETILFHLTRGSDVRGLRGMLPMRDNMIRPLLGCSRQEVEQFLREEHQSYCTDATNDSDEYARNRIRLHVLPQLEKVNKQAVRHIARAGESVREAQDYLEQQVMKAYETCFRRTGADCGRLDIKAFDGLHEYLQSQVVYWIIAQLTGHEKDLTKAHVEAVLSLRNNQSGKSVLVYRRLRVTREYDALVFETGKKTDHDMEPMKLDISKDGFCFLEDGRKLSWRRFSYDARNMRIPKNQYTKWYDYDKINGGLFVRNRQESDYLVIDSQGHRKHLQDYFIDEKIPAAKRQVIPLVAEGSHILWIIGYRGSELYRITPDTSNILEIVIDGGN